eukprot:TRINITY_DN2689_c0_g1_i1.p1 TRINITY_DN2689_c0_g1~~TRINITY_DN2689_c0_g1_i1.p1  ORF type:complete len:235 (+),score=25.00 TRINITY_DN2689_c0_g1_i1:39-743(+)
MVRSRNLSDLSNGDHVLIPGLTSTVSPLDVVNSELAGEVDDGSAGEARREDVRAPCVLTANASLQQMEPEDADETLNIPIPFGLSILPTSRADSSSGIEHGNEEEEGGNEEEEGATTLVVRNVPYEITTLQFRRCIDASGFEGLYDMVFMPVCSNFTRNAGYGFVNFLSPTMAVSFTRAWHQTWEFNGAFRMLGPVTVSPARIQGREANLKSLKRSKLLRLRDVAWRPFVRDLD